MQINQLTETIIRQFAGSTIFQRGYGYYESGMVYQLQYDASTDSIEAEVAGNYGDYDVNVTTQGGQLSAECDCPYDGYPCKHIVATLLTFIHNKDQYAQQAAAQKKSDSSLTKKIKVLSKDELAAILIDCVKKYPEVKRDLMVRLESGSKATYSTLKNQVARAFPSVSSSHYSIHSITKQLKTILKTVENGSTEIKIKVYWAIIGRTLKELNDYGMDEESLENVVIDTMEKLKPILLADETLHEEKQMIIEQLMQYYLRGNCGLVDWLYDAAEDLCSEKSDFEILIAALEKTSSSYHRGLLASLYAAIGDTDAERKALEKDLKYGMDYWRLAEYWYSQGNDEKALQIVQQGLEHGQGRKTELYDALQRHYEQLRDYERIFTLLEQKIAKKDVSGYGSLRQDSTYAYLWKYYASQQNHEGQKSLLQLCLSSNDIDLELYKQAEQTFHTEDWQEFRLKLVETLQQQIRGQGRQNRPMGGFPGISFMPYAFQSAVQTLAQIYAYENNAPLLFETIKDSVHLLTTYEGQLLPEFAAAYLEKYRAQIERLIAARGRNNYKAAVPYANTIKRIYTEMLNTPDKWTEYITNLRQNNKTLRAFQQEFADL